MTRTEELESLVKPELVALAEEYELDTTGTKATLAERIVAFETGAPPAEEPDEVDEPELEPEPQPEPEPVDQGEVRLVRFIGRNSFFQTGKFTFTRDNPFQAVPSAIADEVTRKEPHRYRLATDSEVQEFYS